MSEPSFDPFLDWEAITPEMEKDLRAALKRFRAAQEVFVREGGIEFAGEMLKHQWELTRTIEAIHQTIFTIPVMVHEAGEKKTEEDDDWGDVVRQRCSRCGSILCEWMERMIMLTPAGPQHVEESDIPWWGPGQRVAKAGTDGDESHMKMYAVPDRKLETHEMLCVDLQDLFGG